MVAGAQNDPAVAIGLADAQEIARIGFFVDQLGFSGVERLTIDPARPVVVVAPDPVQGAAVIAPDHGAIALIGDGGDVLARLEVANLDLVEFRTGGIHRISQIAVIGRVLDRAQIEILDSVRFGVAIQDDHFLASHLAVLAGRTPGEDRILAAFAIAQIIIPVAIAGGGRFIVFLDAAAHLAVQALFQAGERRHHLVVIGVFRFQVRADVRVQHAGIAHHFLPVVIAQPGEFVGAGAAQLLDLDRALLGRRR